ncbi:MAG: dihydropteroate synthase [Methylobacteriaceae bacterium]|nr:dihydropteroate synthase [Methylobacteriaceae bacterium]
MRAAIRAKRDAFFGAIGKAPLVMGILNLTPDSFSDGGRFGDAEAALRQAQKLLAEGAAIIDVGAESTRPEATPVSEAEEIARLAPMERLVESIDAPFSIDTYKAKVAAFAANSGAILVNDVWGLQRDPAMADIIAEADVGVVITHNRREKDADLDVVGDMRRFFDRSLALAAKAGIAEKFIVLDPGIGFAKTSRQNVAAIGAIGRLADYGLPFMVGASRKRFLGSLSKGGEEASLAGVIAVNLAAAATGASIFRVHDVAENATALDVFTMVRRAAAG